MRLTVFELSAAARGVIANVARLNGVEGRITLVGESTPALLEATIVPGEATFVLTDVEGAELMLLDPAEVPTLRDATILVETHDLLAPGCHDTVARRFAASHRIEEVDSEVRTLDEFPPALAPRWRRWFPRLALEAIVEPRGGPQTFMLLTPLGSR